MTHCPCWSDDWNGSINEILWSSEYGNFISMVRVVFWVFSASGTMSCRTSGWRPITLNIPSSRMNFVCACMWVLYSSVSVNAAVNGAKRPVVLSSSVRLKMSLSVVLSFSAHKTCIVFVWGSCLSAAVIGSCRCTSSNFGMEMPSWFGCAASSSLISFAVSMRLVV